MKFLPINIFLYGTFDIYVCGWIDICTVRLVFVEVRFACMRFDLSLYGWIDIC